MAAPDASRLISRGYSANLHTMNKRNIFLIGLMGAGKTTIGRQLARSLGCEFIDSDHEIEHRTGADIPWIFDIEGEQGFRERERAVIDDLSQRQGIVLATGGGAILDVRNREHLAARGLVIYLRASVDRLAQRTDRDRNRPLLQTDDPVERLQRLYDQRDPLYREIADFIVDTDNRNVSNSIKLIISQFNKQNLDESPQN
jgi:shikimate kinase